MQSDFDICCTHLTNYIFLTMPVCRNTAALTNCTVIRRQSFLDVFSDQAAQTCFQTCPCIKRFAVLMPHVLNKVVQLHMNEINKKCSCRPANLIRLHRRIPVTRFTMSQSDITTWLSSRQSADVVNFYTLLAYILFSADDLDVPC